jgi:hypothetical protein
MKQGTIRARDAQLGDIVRIDGEGWTVGGSFEPPDVMDLSLSNEDGPFNLHIGAQTIVALIDRET